MCLILQQTAASASPPSGSLRLSVPLLPRPAKLFGIFAVFRGPLPGPAVLSSCAFLFSVSFSRFGPLPLPETPFPAPRFKRALQGYQIFLSLSSTFFRIFSTFFRDLFTIHDIAISSYYSTHILWNQSPPFRKFFSLLIPSARFFPRRFLPFHEAGRPPASISADADVPVPFPFCG